MLALLALTTVLAALAKAPWRSVASNELAHVWWGAVLIVVLAWLMRPALPGGLNVHFLGATVLTLMFGARLALVAIAIAAVGAVLFAGLPAQAWPREVVASGLAAIGLSKLVLYITQRYLPKNAFVYIFVAAFAAAWFATFCAAMLDLTLFAPAPHAFFEGGVLTVFALLLAFGEATLTGMCVAVMVALRPQWLASFDDRIYFARRPS